jgi:hypothetical protein
MKPQLCATMVAHALFGIGNVRRHRAYQDWSSVHATREPAQPLLSTRVESS